MANRGEVWLLDLSPTRGHEQAGKRPALIVSTDAYNHGPAQLAVVIPLTTKDRHIPLWVPIDPPDGGVQERCFAMCDAIRSVSTDRLERQWGTVQRRTLAAVEDRLRILLDL
jgi:mRNA interferase MazF